MFADLVNSLTPGDRKALAELGVPSSRISEWKSLNRFPTRPQAAAISIVKGVPLDELERELAMMELKADTKYATVLRKLSAAGRS